MSEKKPPPLVMVEWEDASVKDDAAWADNENHTYEPKMFQQVGFLLYDGPEGVILTCAWNELTVAARDQIPRGMIHRVKRLKA